MFYKRNSDKLLDISKKIERLPLSNPVERKNGKRKSHHLHSKVDDCEKRTEKVGKPRDITRSEGMMTKISPQYTPTNLEDIQLFDLSPPNIR